MNSIYSSICKFTNFNLLFSRIICPSKVTAGTIITILTIVSKVRLESFLWGAGTAIGELPPYFMARTARLSGEKLEEEDDDQDSKWHTVKETIKTLVERVGFLGILACASVSQYFIAKLVFILPSLISIN